LRIVPDTTFLIRAHGRGNSRARRLLNLLLDSDHRLVLSSELIVEVVRVLRYPRFQELYGLCDAELLEFVQYLQSIADMVLLDPHFTAPVLRDASDLHVLQTAILGEADILVTSDNDFSKDANVIAYCLSRGIEISSEADLLTRLGPK
jgi:putative PIN family toxin of toxin-antitoxin system